jgi:hypothetical protein
MNGDEDPVCSHHTGVIWDEQYHQTECQISNNSRPNDTSKIQSAKGLNSASRTGAFPNGNRSDPITECGCEYGLDVECGKDNTARGWQMIEDSGMIGH